MIVLSIFVGTGIGARIYKEYTRVRKQAAETQGHVPYGVYEAFIKRPLDAAVAGMALIVISPVMAATALLVRAKLGAPILFAQKRPGLNGKVFTIYKFRTMNDRRGEDGELLPDEERLTGFGKMLRSTSLDELPELYNILLGDMSIVAPRP